MATLSNAGFDHSEEQQETPSEPSLKFRLKRKELPVEIEDENGTLQKCVLRELTGTMRNTFVNLVSSRMVGVKGGGTVLKDSSGIQSDLVSKSLYDDSGRNVGPKTIESWPASVQEALFKAAQKLSGLGNDAEDDAKND